MRIKLGTATKPVWQDWFLFRKTQGPMSLLQSRAQNVEHNDALQIVSAIGEIETFVAEGKVRDLLIAQRHSQAHPIVKRGIDDLIERKAALGIRPRDMTDFATPTLDQRHD